MDESDIYVRDHLLIQWILDFLAFDYSKDTDIEKIYRLWIDWLRRTEVKNDKRSEV